MGSTEAKNGPSYVKHTIGPAILMGDIKGHFRNIKTFRK